MLSAPFELGSRTLRNRVIFAPMDRNYCHEDGTISERYRDYLAERAAGGAALIFPEAAFVRADGRCQTHQMALDTDEIVPRLRELADAIHAHGALLGVQLNHGGNTSKPAISGFTAVAPSPVRSAFTGGPVPEELDHEDIADLIEAYADAAERSVGAGVDVIMVHAAHGYLIHQFMMPSTNQRSDEYGDPARFLSEILVAVRDRIPGVPIVLRASVMDGIEGGLDEDATLQVLHRVPLEHVDLLDITAGSYDAVDLIIPAGERETGWLAGIAERYRELGRPVSVAGRITTLARAEEIVGSGQADVVSVARALHAAPDWPLALLGTPPAAVPRPCVAGNVCIDELGAGAIRCTVNPRAGRESLVPVNLVAPSPIDVLIVGAGPAGLETAVTLGAAGCRVSVVEKATRLGGQFALAATLKGYPEYHRILDWYAAELQRLGIEVELGREIDLAGVRAFEPDAVVVATGSRGAWSTIPGLDHPQVIDVRDWLAGHVGGELERPAEAVIWGGDREALAVGDDLAAHGTKVTFVFGGKAVGREVGRMAKPYMLARLCSDPGVRMLTEARLLAIEADRCEVATAEGRQWLPIKGPLLISQGAEANVPMLFPSELSVPNGVPGDVPGGVHLVGDAAGQGGSLADVLWHARQVASRLSGSQPTAAGS